MKKTLNLIELAENSQDWYNSKSLEELESMYNSISSKKSRSKYMSKDSDYKNCEKILEKVKIAKDLKTPNKKTTQNIQIDQIFSIEELNRILRNLQSRKSIANSMSRFDIVEDLEKSEELVRNQKNKIIQTNQNIMNYQDIKNLYETLKNEPIQNSYTDGMILAIETILKIQ